MVLASLVVVLSIVRFFDIPYTDLNSSSQRMLSVESVEYSPVKSNKIKRVELSRCVALGILFNDSNS